MRLKLARYCAVISVLQTASYHPYVRFDTCSKKKRNLRKVMLGTNILAIVNPGGFPRNLPERLHEKLSAPSSSRTPGILVETNHCDAGEV